MYGDARPEGLATRGLVPEGGIVHNLITNLKPNNRQA